MIFLLLVADLARIAEWRRPPIVFPERKLWTAKVQRQSQSIRNKQLD
jgi:hypothetical protein